MSTICTAVLNVHKYSFRNFKVDRHKIQKRDNSLAWHECFIISFNLSESIDSQLDSCHSCDQYLDKTLLIIGNGKIRCPLDICRVRLPDCTSRDRAQNILLLTAKTVYIQLHFLLIFRYFISYNLLFFGTNKKIIWLMVDSRLARDLRLTWACGWLV